jgi:hypothetical protein
MRASGVVSLLLTAVFVLGSDTGALWLRATAGGCAAAVVAALATRLARPGAGKHLQPQPA